jgi:hypothetical protein
MCRRRCTAIVMVLFAAGSAMAEAQSGCKPESGGVTPLAIVLPSSEAVPQSATASIRTIAETFLTDRLHFWQTRLNLQEWNVAIVMTRRAALKAGTLGGIRWDKSRRTASMAVLDASDYTMPTPEMLKDMEFTVVHELIHLALASLPRSEASRRTEELAVNNLTRALLASSGER